MTLFSYDNLLYYLNKDNVRMKEVTFEVKPGVENNATVKYLVYRSDADLQANNAWAYSMNIKGKAPALDQKEIAQSSPLVTAAYIIEPGEGA